MPTADLPITPVTLDPNWCPSSEQERLNKFAESTVQLSSGSFTLIVTGSSTPAASDRDKLWKKPNDPKLYEWNASVGAWVAEHPYGFGTDVRVFWTGDLSSLETFDGGASGTIGDASGPMWVPDTSMAGRVAIGAGSLPSGTVLTIGATGGEDQHTQTINELVAHDHIITNVDNTTNTLAAGTGTGGGIVIPRTQATTEETGGSQPFNVLNPYKTGTWAKRSSRRYYKGN